MKITMYILRKNKKKHKLIINFSENLLGYDTNICSASIPEDIYENTWYPYIKLRYIIYRKFRIWLPRYKSLKWLIDISDQELKQFAVIKYAAEVKDNDGIHIAEE